MPRFLGGLALAAVLAAAGCRDDDSPPAPAAAPSAAPAALEFYASDGQVIVTWAGVADAASYTVYYANATGVTPANYAGLPGGTRVTGVANPVKLTGLANTTLYYLVVTAANAGGEGPASAEISFMPQAQAAMPDFTLTDVNPNSATFNTGVSPGQYLGLFPGFYFGHAT
jgi:hypothetical protein